MTKKKLWLLNPYQFVEINNDCSLFNVKLVINEKNNVFNLNIPIKLC